VVLVPEQILGLDISVSYALFVEAHEPVQEFREIRRDLVDPSEMRFHEKRIRKKYDDRCENYMIIDLIDELVKLKTVIAVSI